MALFDKNKRMKKILAEHYRNMNSSDPIRKQILDLVYPRGETEFVYAGLLLRQYVAKEDIDLARLLPDYVSVASLFSQTNGDVIRCMRYLQGKGYDSQSCLTMLGTVICTKDERDVKTDPTTDNKKFLDACKKVAEGAEKGVLYDKYGTAFDECNLKYEKEDLPEYVQMFDIMRELIRSKLSIRELLQMHGRLKKIVLDASIPQEDIIVCQEKEMEAICENAKYLSLNERKLLAFCMSLAYFGATERPNFEAFTSASDIRKMFEADEEDNPYKYLIPDRSVEFTGSDEEIKALEEQGYEVKKEQTMRMYCTDKITGRDFIRRQYTVYATKSDSDGLDDRNYIYSIRT